VKHHTLRAGMDREEAAEEEGYIHVAVCFGVERGKEEGSVVRPCTSLANAQAPPTLKMKASGAKTIVVTHCPVCHVEIEE
jgi:heterodisulfide reductase subunit B